MAYQLPQPQQLGDIYEMNPGAFGDAMGLMRLGSQFANVDLQKQQEELNQSRRLNPVKAQQEEATLQSTLFENKTKERQGKLDEEFFPQKREAEMRKYLISAGADEQSMASQAAAKLLRDPNPEQRKQGEALMRALPESWKKRYEEDITTAGKLREIAASGANQIKVANIYASRPIGGSAALGEHGLFLKQLYKLKPADQHNALTAEIARIQAVDPERAAVYEQMREAVTAAAQEDLYNRKKPGDLVVVTTPEGKTRYVPRPVLDLGAPAAATEGRPARQATPAPGKAQPTQADLEFTAKKYNITVEEVKKKLGLK